MRVCSQILYKYREYGHEFLSYFLLAKITNKIVITKFWSKKIIFVGSLC